MRILILANDDSGLYEFRRELLERLITEHEVYFTVPVGNLVSRIEALGCKYIPCDVLKRHGVNPLQELKLLDFYKNLLDDIKPGIVFTYTIKPNVYGGMACIKKNIPYVANITGLGTAVENGGLMQKITLEMYRLGLRKAQKVFFQNTANRDFMIQEHVIKTDCDLLPGSGVNLTRFKAFPYPNGETVDFLFVGRLMKEKGIDQYLDAAKAIRKKYPETRFHICGTYEQDYEEKVDRLISDGTVIFHGDVVDMVPMYQKASCVIHPSYYPEGLSNVLLEASACARPIITTNRPGCREVIDNGVNGYVVNQKDSLDLICKIEKFLGLGINERRAMGLAGRAKVEKGFDRQIVIQKYVDEVEKARKTTKR